MCGGDNPGIGSLTQRPRRPGSPDGGPAAQRGRPARPAGLLDQCVGNQPAAAGKISKLVLTPEEAAGYEKSSTWNVNEAGQRAKVESTPASRWTGAHFATKGDKSFWLDPGRHFGTVKGEISRAGSRAGERAADQGGGRARAECRRLWDVRWTGDPAAGGALHRRLRPHGRPADDERALQQQLPDRAVAGRTW